MDFFFSETGSYQVTDQQASNTQRSCRCLPSTEIVVCTVHLALSFQTQGTYYVANMGLKHLVSKGNRKRKENNHRTDSLSHSPEGLHVPSRLGPQTRSPVPTFIPAHTHSVTLDEPPVLASPIKKKWVKWDSLQEACSSPLLCPTTKAGRGRTIQASISLSTLGTEDHSSTVSRLELKLCVRTRSCTGARAWSGLSRWPVLNMSPIAFPWSTLSSPFICDLTMTHPL